MPKKTKKEKLLPLRRFASPDLYSIGYLSLLVQRKKLKAHKIGRNYFTTVGWFKEYLDQHAQEEIRAKYANRIERNHFSLENVKADNFSSFSLKPRNIFKKIIAAVAVATAVFVLLFYSWRLLNPGFGDNKGIVAGEQEINNDIGN